MTEGRSARLAPASSFGLRHLSLIRGFGLRISGFFILGYSTLLEFCPTPMPAISCTQCGTSLSTDGSCPRCTAAVLGAADSDGVETMPAEPTPTPGSGSSHGSLPPLDVVVANLPCAFADYVLEAEI